jgi:opacity protein-like surface antigen
MVDNRVNNIVGFLIILVFIVPTFILGRYSVSPEPIEVERVVYDTITNTEVRVDTMWRTRVEKVYLTEVRRDTVTVRDTVLVEVPIYTYVAQDSLYRVEAEGFNVRFKRVDVYPRTVYRTQEKVVKTGDKWGLGVQAGYGISGHGLSPYIGIGISYNILTW